MIRFMLTINDIVYALPFSDFTNVKDCITSANNLALLLNHFEIQCVDRATGIAQYVIKRG